jgi:prepilin-type N-terminal cleavage/methylation domain-containing protein
MFKSAWKAGGFSLVEALVAMLILGILMSLAVPSLSDTVSRQRARGSVEGVRAAMQGARSEAVKTGGAVFATFTPGGAWCAAISRGQACGCANPCTPDEDLVGEVDGSNFPATTIVSASFAGSLCGAIECVRFEPQRGAAFGSNGTVLLESATGARYKIIVSILGRVRVCVVSGDPSSQWPSC